MNYDSENDNQEIDLIYLCKSASSFMTKIGLEFYNFLIFLKKYAFIIIGIIAIGAGIGYYKDRNSAEIVRHDIIVIPNFQSVDYLYENLPKCSFIEEIASDTNSSISNSIKKIEIKPIENVNSLFEDENDVMLPIFKIFTDRGGKAADLTKEKSIFKNYKYHIISIFADKDSNPTEIIDSIFNKLNSNEYYLEKQKIAIVQNQVKKEEIEKSLRQVNEILDNLGKRENLLDTKGMSMNNFSDLDNLFNRKDLILKSLSVIKEEIIEQDKIVYITNKNMNNYEGSSSKYIYITPISLLFLFFISIFFLNFIKKFKSIKEKELN